MKDNKDEVKELVTQYKHQDSEIEITKAVKTYKEDNQKKEMWRWHQKMYHLSFPKIKLTAQQLNLLKQQATT